MIQMHMAQACLTEQCIKLWNPKGHGASQQWAIQNTQPESLLEIQPKK